ncbi:hypothetical protein GBAR_LOCUS22164, partial [Geodia barretti]
MRYVDLNKTRDQFNQFSGLSRTVAIIYHLHTIHIQWVKCEWAIK